MSRDGIRSGGELSEQLPDVEQEAAEMEERERGAGRAVRPIRDEPDELVFRFEVGPAILAQLLEKLSRIKLRPLDEALSAKYPGFYQLFLRGEPKYIGKTSRPVGVRLREHRIKLSGRRGIDMKDVTCRFAFVEDPSLVDVAEGALINFFGDEGMADWNTSGFGSKVTGHGRGGQGASKWSEEFPHDTERLVPAGDAGPLTPVALARQLIDVAPITLSVPTKFRKAFSADHTTAFDIPIAVRPFSEWVAVLEGVLAPGWWVDRQAESWYIYSRETGA